MKRIFTRFLLVICCAVCLINGARVAQAADKPMLNVTLAPFLATLPGAADGQDILNGEVQLAVYQQIKNKLLQMDGAGQLPFHLALQEGESSNHVFGDDFSLSLMPIVTLDRSFDDYVTLNGVGYHASMLVSGLDLALVSRSTMANESEDVMAEGKKSMRLLFVLPISAKSEEPKKSIGSPVSMQAKRDIYLDITSQAIEQQMVFPSKKQDFSHAVEKALQQGLDTYQVTQVAFRSQRAKNQIFPGEKGAKLQQLVASVYTTSFQQATGQVVLPSVFGNDALDQNVNRMRINTPLGEQELSWEEPKHNIALNIYGVNDGVIDAGKAATQHHMYKAWFAASEADAGREPEPLTKHKVLIEVPGADSQLTPEALQQRKAKTEYNVFTVLFYELAHDMAQKKR